MKLSIWKYFSKSLLRNFHQFQGFRPSFLMSRPFTAIQSICNQRTLVQDEKMDFWEKTFMDEELIFMNVVSKLYKIINGCTTEEWKRIMPMFFWDKQQEDQRRRFQSSYYRNRSDNCDPDSEWFLIGPRGPLPLTPYRSKTLFFKSSSFTIGPSSLSTMPG